MADPGAEPTPEYEERRRLSFWERMDAIEQECRRGHTALRKDISELQAQTTALSKALEVLTASMTALASGPVEYGRVRFSSQALYTIGSAVLVVVGIFYTTSSGVRSDVRALSIQSSADTKRQDDRYTEITKALDRQAAESARQDRQRSDDKAAAALLLRKYDEVEDLKRGARK